MKSGRNVLKKTIVQIVWKSNNRKFVVFKPVGGCKHVVITCMVDIEFSNRYWKIIILVGKSVILIEKRFEMHRNDMQNS